MILKLCPSLNHLTGLLKQENKVSFPSDHIFTPIINIMSESASIHTVQSAITDEIFFALGLNRRGWVRRAFGWVFSPPTRIFASYMTAVDAAMAQGGSPAGCRVMMKALHVKIESRGQSNIPTRGPTLILANHPGAYDSMAIGSLVPRPDLKAIVSKTRLYEVLPNLRPNVFFVSKDPGESMLALKNAIEHLRQGGILLQFGSGLIEPDPANHTVGDAVFEKWSPSIEIMLRKVPETAVVPTVTSNVLLPRFEKKLLTYLRRGAMDRRRLAEFMQVIQQLLFPKSVQANPWISFGEPFKLDDLEREGTNRRIMPAVINRIKAELVEHLHWANPDSSG